MTEYYGYIDKRSGLPLIRDSHRFVNYFLNEFPDEQPCIITIKKLVRKRSLAQNRWYFGVAIDKFIIPFIAETQGETVSKTEVHAFHLMEICKCSFRPVSVMGKAVLIMDDVKTSDMTTREFDDFKDKIQAYWSEKGLVIPNPNEDNLLNQVV